MTMLTGYQTDKFYDELISQDNHPRVGTEQLCNALNTIPEKELINKQHTAELLLAKMGVSFNFAPTEGTCQSMIPLDIIPRVINQKDWLHLERGIKQRIYALNLFIQDIYSEQKIIRNKVVPESVVIRSQGYLPICKTLKPPNNIWVHITGSDIVRDNKGNFYVLEDNLRCPSGIAYVLKSRFIEAQLLPEVYQKLNIAPVSPYIENLYKAMQYASPGSSKQPLMVVLTPGIYNSAYYEHAFLAQQLGIPLVQNSDLVVIDHFVMLKTTRGYEKVDVIYRRIDDQFLDSDVFDKQSLLSVPGIIESYRQGHVALINAPGAGVADDKAIYAYVPDIIKYYLGEDAILPNIPTFCLEKANEQKHVLAHLDNMVIKARHLSGGKGMMIGSQASSEEKKLFAAKIKYKPHDYIAQPILSLSTCPTVVNDKIEARHVDFRPFTLFGEDLFILPGGLTRVACKKNSLIVNSSQGGGIKDTWVLSGSHNILC